MAGVVTQSTKLIDSLKYSKPNCNFLKRNSIVMVKFYFLNRKLMTTDILIPKCCGAMTGKQLSTCLICCRFPHPTKNVNNIIDFVAINYCVLRIQTI